MDTDIRIVCIQVAPSVSGGGVSLASSGGRDEIRSVLERAMDVVDRSGNAGQRHIAELERRALAPGKTVDLPWSTATPVSAAGLLHEPNLPGQGIVRTVA